MRDYLGYIFIIISGPITIAHAQIITTIRLSEIPRELAPTGKKPSYATGPTYVSCFHEWYLDKNRNMCLPICGHTRCLHGEACDYAAHQCHSVCTGCHSNQFCDVNTGKCEPCHPYEMCSRRAIHAYPDCQNNCPDEYRRLKTPQAAVTVETPITTVKTPETEEISMNGLAVVVSLVGTFVVALLSAVTGATIFYVRIRKKMTKKFLHTKGNTRRKDDMQHGDEASTISHGSRTERQTGSTGNSASTSESTIGHNPQTQETVEVTEPTTTNPKPKTPKCSHQEITTPPTTTDHSPPTNQDIYEETVAQSTTTDPKYQSTDRNPPTGSPILEVVRSALSQTPSKDYKDQRNRSPIPEARKSSNEPSNRPEIEIKVEKPRKMDDMSRSLSIASLGMSNFDPRFDIYDYRPHSNSEQLAAPLLQRTVPVDYAKLALYLTEQLEPMESLNLLEDAALQDSSRASPTMNDQERHRMADQGAWGSSSAKKFEDINKEEICGRIDNLSYVVYYFQQEKQFLVAIRRGEVTIGEARADLLNLGVPADTLKVVVADLDSVSADSGL